jgi:hypothetical protein
MFWRFSLRTLLFAITGCAIVAGALKLLGPEVLAWLLVVTAIIIGVVATNGSTRNALLQSFVAVYGPFIVMACYAVLFVDCSHCKTTSWEILPIGPGLVSLTLAHHFLPVPRLDDPVSFPLSVVLALGAIGALTFLVRGSGRWPGVVILAVAVSYFSFCAWGLLALLQA